MPINVGGNSVAYSGLTEYGDYTKRVVKGGLICEYDAGHIDSYPGTGTSWYDISNSGIASTLTITGSPTWGSVSGVTCFTLDALGEYMSGTYPTNGPTVGGTMEAWISLTGTELGGTGTDRGCIILCSGGNAIYHSYNKSDYKLSNYWYNKNTEGYHESGAAISHQKWHHTVCVWNNKQVQQWLDGVMTSVDNVFGSSSANNAIYIGREGGTTRQMAGNIAIVRIYNRGLNAYEVAENFQAEKFKFGV